MSIRTFLKVTDRTGRRLQKQASIDLKYKFLVNLLVLSRVDTGMLRGNTFVRRYPLKRAYPDRRIKNPSSAAFTQRRYVRPFGRDIISQTVRYAGIWARKDALIPRTFNITRAQAPGVILGTFR